jgi:elongation factor G
MNEKVKSGSRNVAIVGPYLSGKTTFTDGIVLNGVRTGDLYCLMGQQQQQINQGVAGKIIAISRLEGIKTGETISTNSYLKELPKPAKLEPVFALAITP